MAISSSLHRVFCDNVKARRRQLDLTQGAVADLLGISQPAYAEIESGRRVPSIDVVERVARALTIPPALLLTDTALTAAE